MPKYWWVNQGSSYESERDGRYLFASETTGGGVEPDHWADLKKLVSGDVVFHYANGAIRAVSRVAAAANRGHHPSGGLQATSGGPSQIGNTVRTDYEELTDPISLGEIPGEWRTPNAGPFTAGEKKSGGVRQGLHF
jgi:hypothetical protein